MKVLRVRNWEKDFESAKSREYNHRSQFYCPNKHGLGYQRILANDNGEAIYGCWIAMCQVLSRQDKPRHGYLTDTGRILGRQWTALDVSLLTRYSESTCQKMLALCESELVGWLEYVESTDTKQIPQSPYPSTILYSPSPSTDVKADASHGYPTPLSHVSLFPELNTPEINDAWNHYVSMRATMRGKPFSIMAAELMLRFLHGLGPAKALKSIEASLKAGWPDLYDPDQKRGGEQSRKRVEAPI